MPGYHIGALDRWWKGLNLLSNPSSLIDAEFQPRDKYLRTRRGRQIREKLANHARFRILSKSASEHVEQD